MNELTKEDIKLAVIEALRSEEGQDLLFEAMARKLEITAGWNCKDADERREIRKDQEFTRYMRTTAQTGLNRTIFWLIGVGGVIVLSYIGSHQNLWK